MTIVRSAAERGDTHTGWQNGDPSPRLNKRVRKVFPTDEVPHKWAHQAQSEARNPQGNLFFFGAVIYSYRLSYPIAHIFKSRKKPLVLIRSERYSVTTARHLNLAARATSHLEQILVPDVMPDSDGHGANIAYLVEQHAEALAKAKRALSTWPARYAYDRGKQALKDAQAYRDYFKVKGAKIPRFPADEWKAALARVDRIVNPDPASKDKRERASARRQVKAREALRVRFDYWCERIEAHNAAVTAACTMTAEQVGDHWREHGVWLKGNAGYGPGWSLFCPWSDQRKFERAGLGRLPVVENGDLPRPDHVLLRVDGDQIQTSQGARVPVAVAAAVWARVERCRLNGQAYERRSDALGGVKIGDYPLDRIDSDGTLHAGCHHIPHHELERMARSLGLTV